jgi:iron complex transport system substrate-binding protein
MRIRRPSVILSTSTILLYLFIVITNLCMACKNNSHTVRNVDEGMTMTNKQLEYAKGFRIQYFKNARRITILNPWQGAENISYQYIVSSVKPDSIALAGSIWIKKPVHRIICLSTTQIGMIEFAGELEAIVGISGAQYVCNSYIRKKIAEGRIVDVGYDITLNFELIFSLKPDLVLIYGVNSEASSLYNRLHSYGIQAMFIGEYLEPDPLAKAEWVKLIACLFDKDSIVTDQYSRMAIEYRKLKQLTLNIRHRPVVMTGLPWKEAWNIPGGDSFTARLIMDAGGNYLWSKRETRDNIPMKLEQAVSDSKNADIWINSGIARSIADIKSTDERLVRLRPILIDKVFNNNRNLCPGGGNAYWESGVVHPELILQDLIMIFHPELKLSKEFSFYRKLE